MKMERIYFSINKLMNYINENKVFDKYVDPYDNNVRILCKMDDDYLLGGKLNSIYLLNTNNTKIKGVLNGINKFVSNLTLCE